jgi:hypothetical protein
VIRSRLVLHFGGYDPVLPTSSYRRFMRGLERFRQTWSVISSASDPVLIADHRGSWDVVTKGPNWQVETQHRLFRWDDIIAEYAARPAWWRLPMGFLAFADFVAGGAFWGYLRTNWRYALFLLYPYLLLLLMMAASGYAGAFAASASGSVAIGIVSAVLAFVAFYLVVGRWAYLPVALDDWIFARAYIRRRDPKLERRLDALADEIIAADSASSVDEILLLGHSLGAVLAIDVLDRALRRKPDLGSVGPRLALVTVGSSILKIGLIPCASADCRPPADQSYELSEFVTCSNPTAIAASGATCTVSIPSSSAAMSGELPTIISCSSAVPCRQSIWPARRRVQLRQSARMASCLPQPCLRTLMPKALSRGRELPR